MPDVPAPARPSGRYGHAACALFVLAFAVLWAVARRDVDGSVAGLALCLLPAVALAAILLDMFDTAFEVRSRLARRLGPARVPFERTRIGLILGAKLLCWAVVPAILWVAIPELWKGATGADVESPSLQVMRNGRELLVQGDIGRGFAARLSVALDRNPGIRSLSLDSPGGLSSEGVEARAVVEARGLDTYVEADCQSACVDVLLGGRRREAAAGAGIALHHPGVEFGTLRLDAGGGVPDGFLRGVPPAFRARALGTPFSESWAPSPNELVAAGVLTAYVDGGGHAIIPRPAWATREGAYAALVGPTLLSDVASSEGAAVERIVAFATRSVHDARSRKDVFDRFRRMTSLAVLSRVARADGATVRAAAGAIADAMDDARERYPSMCGRIGAEADLLGVHGLRLPDPARRGEVRAILAAATGMPPAPEPAYVLDASDEASWRPILRADADCSAETAFYRGALASGDAGIDGLRERFIAILARPVVQPPAAASAAGP